MAELDKLVLDNEIEELFRFIQSRGDFDFSHYKKPGVQRCIGRRMNMRQINSFSEYFSIINQDENELNELISAITIEYSLFFRDKEAFDILRKKVLNEVIARTKRDGNGSIRVWCAGCATGEEAYSIAMVLFELLYGRFDVCKPIIFATDVDERSLEKARKGVYRKEAVTHLDDDILRRYFYHKEDYIVRDFIRKLIYFGTHNILEDPPISHLDLLVCRNVLIYLDVKAQEDVLRNFHYALNKDGYLFIGKSEVLLDNFKTAFETVDGTWRIFRKKE